MPINKVHARSHAILQVVYLMSPSFRHKDHIAWVEDCFIHKSPVQVGKLLEIGVDYIRPKLRRVVIIIVIIYEGPALQYSEGGRTLHSFLPDSNWK